MISVAAIIKAAAKREIIFFMQATSFEKSAAA
jgi:hypothetical protein